MSLDFGQLVREVGNMPTVQAGIILALGRVRNGLEAFRDVEDWDGISELLHDLDTHSAELADAIVVRTPAQAGHEQRAAQIQAEQE